MLLRERVRLHSGDCLVVLDTMAENSIDAVVTDPPYHFASIVKRFGSEAAAPAQYGSDGAFQRASRGFMGKEWDGGDIAFRPETWAKVLRVMKPGAHLVAFGAPKNYHRLACAIEDAGFEVRDSLMWVFGSGFPKSHNLDDDWQGWGTALKPAYEPIVLARKPLSEKTVAANVQRWGTGAINVDATRVGDFVATQPSGLHRGEIADYSPKNPDDFKPAISGAIGRWPANLCHDGSDEVLAGFPQSASGVSNKQRGKRPGGFGNVGAEKGDGVPNGPQYGDEGSVARFFYCAKASKSDRSGSRHPTVKPVSLMRWLCRMVTPPNGVILDPFGGSGTTGQAAYEEGFEAVLIEREAEYAADIERRMESVGLV